MIAKRITTSLFLLFIVITATFGQRISNILGCYLGQSQGEAVATLKRQFPNSGWQGNVYVVNNPVLGNIGFPSGAVRFANNRLYSVSFDESVLCGELAVTHISQRVGRDRIKSKFENALRQFTSKYGKPSYYDGSSAVWSNSGNVIELVFTAREDDMRLCAYELTLEYRISSYTNY